MVSEPAIREVLAGIPDPEMPISIVDLGLVERVEVLPSRDREGAIVTIDLLPTFVGCPALPMIEGEVRARVGRLEGVAGVEVRFVHTPAWSVERITPAGRESLRAHGVTVPERGDHARAAALIALRVSAPASTPVTGESAGEPPRPAVPCPYCGSDRTRIESRFGPTRCRMIWYCDACRNSFEHLKRV
jgi:ring-1,2-phenylacetyl-CoA epoxidase subunit PaaD